MSEGLQSVAGDLIRNIISKLTSNRYSAVIVGCLVTMIVQSSSVTTVMVVGFVNAQLMTLTQAIGVIFGANIGTTITGWIISIKIGKYGLLLIGLGIFPYLFSNNSKFKNSGRILFSIGMVFLGLDIMSNAFKPLRGMPEFLEAISYFKGQHYGNYFACILVGCALTMIIQSSSAMLGITMALCTSGVINFNTGAALILGENIGTTITALLAAIGASSNAKRAARAHAIFNVLGVMVIFSIFPFFVEFIDWLVPGDPGIVNAAGEYPNIAVHLASGHTFFNVMATLIFLPFVNHLARLVTRITPDTKDHEVPHLVMLGDPKDILSATGIVQANAEIKKMKDIVNRMYHIIEDIYREGEGYKNLKASQEKLQHYEQVTDNMQKEVSLFCLKLMERALSPEESKKTQSLVMLADELETIADYLDDLGNYAGRGDLKDLFKEDAGEEFFGFFKEVKEFYQKVTSHIDSMSASNHQENKKLSLSIWEKAENLRHNHISRVSTGKYSALSSLTFSDMVVALRKIRSHTENMSKVMARPKEVV